MALKNSIKAAPLSSLNSAGFDNTLQIISPDSGIPGATSLLRIINGSNTNIGVSYDGIVVHDTVLAATTLELNFQSNAQPSNFVAVMPRGTRVYIVAAAPGVGFVFLATYYQQEGY